tara:strand:+ start:460 stop:621 length:162 start_codon:yes stop_codon:yes gene_type:complete
MERKRRHWGKSKIYYCEKNKVVWQWTRLGKVYTYVDMPSYGVERKELPKENLR